MRLGPIEAVRVFTGDIERAKAFYRDGLALTLLVEADDACLFDTGQAKLLLERVDPGDEEAGDLVGRFAGLSFTVADMDAVVAELEAKEVRFTGAPEAQPWGGILAHFFDPDGNVLTLVQYPESAS